MDKPRVDCQNCPRPSCQPPKRPIPCLVRRGGSGHLPDEASGPGDGPGGRGVGRQGDGPVLLQAGRQNQRQVLRERPEDQHFAMDSCQLPWQTICVAAGWRTGAHVEAGPGLLHGEFFGVLAFLLLFII